MPHRYASYNPAWWAKVLGAVGFYRVRNLLCRPNDALVGRKLTVAREHPTLPPVGTEGRVAGYEGTRYRLRFPGHPDILMKLPARQIELS